MATEKKGTRKNPDAPKKPNHSTASSAGDSSSPPVSKHYQPLAAELPWIATLGAYWRTAGKPARQKALEHFRRAQERSHPEENLNDLYEGLTALGLGTLEIIKLLLTQQAILISIGPADTIERMARQMRAILESLESQWAGDQPEDQ